MRSLLVKRSALAALLFVCTPLAIAAAPAAKPAKPVVVPAKPKAGTLAGQKHPGGWLLDIAGTAEHAELRAAGFSASSSRTLVVGTATSDDYTALLASHATLVDASGKLLRSEALAANRAFDGDLSPDGKSV